MAEKDKNSTEQTKDCLFGTTYKQVTNNLGAKQSKKAPSKSKKNG